MKKLLFPLVIGAAGVAVLLSLGAWQMQRLAWKEAILSDIGKRVTSEPVSVPAHPDQHSHQYLPVVATGRVTGDPIRVLASQKVFGAGHRMISRFETQGRLLMLDRGFAALQAKVPCCDASLTVVGNLHWPNETDSYTPAPDAKTGVWFARDVVAMAQHLGTEPILIVAREIEPVQPGIVPLPVDTSNIPNDHLEYAITWFSLALIWLVMTAYWVWRNTARTREPEDQ